MGFASCIYRKIIFCKPRMVLSYLWLYCINVSGESSLLRTVWLFFNFYFFFLPKAVACRPYSQRYCYCLMWPPRRMGANSAKLLLLLMFFLASLLQNKGLLFPEHGCRTNLVISFLRIMSFSADGNCYITQFNLSVFLSFLLPYVWTSNSSLLLALLCCSSEEIKLGICVAFKCINPNPLVFKSQ